MSILEALKKANDFCRENSITADADQLMRIALLIMERG